MQTKISSIFMVIFIALIAFPTAAAAASPGHNLMVKDVTTITAPRLQEGGGQGCTPGFWKNNAPKKGADQWVNYSPDQDFSSVFGVDYDGDLLAALKKGGGGVYALGRHATAAILNAASDVDYAYTEAEIIAMVQDAFNTGEFEAAKNLFAEQNEAGCPLSNNGKNSGDTGGDTGGGGIGTEE